MRTFLSHQRGWLHMNRNKLAAVLVCVILSLSLQSLRAAVDVICANAQGGVWSTPTNISKTTNSVLHQDMAADRQGNVYVVWGEQLDGTGYGDALYYTVWDGVSWSKPNDVFYSPSDVHIPAVATDSMGYVHAIWDHARGRGIYYTHAFTDMAWNASFWSTPYDIAEGRYAYFCDIAIDSEDNIHVVWEDRTDDEKHSELYYARSADSGYSWSLPLNITDSPGASTVPRIAVDSQNNVHVVWMEETVSVGGYIGDLGVFYLKSSDGGNTWSEPEHISREGMQAGAPDIVITSDNHVHVIWVEITEGRGLYHRAWDGKTWSIPTNISDLTSRALIWWPQAAVDSADNIHLVWRDQGLEDFTTIYYSQSSDGGNTWSTSETIASGPIAGSWRVDVAVSSGNRINVIWWGSDGQTGQIFYSTKLSSAPAWTPAPLPPTPTPTLWPTTTALPLPVATATMTPSPTPVAEIFTPINPVNPSRGATYSLIAGVAPVVVLLGLVVLVRSLRRRDVF